MTLYRTKGCDCTVPRVMGSKRPAVCRHGNRFQTEAELRPKERTPLRRVGVGAGTESAGCRGTETSAVAAVARAGADSSAPRIRRKPLKRSEPKRDWSLARQKIDEEGGCCRVCAAFSAEAAHILGRKFDQPISPGSKTLLVLPDRIVPLCGEQFGHGCHRRYDAHELDLLPYLTTAEQAQAVLDAGSIGLALSRISGPDRVLA